jgi:hypothetical protein
MEGFELKSIVHGRFLNVRFAGQDPHFPLSKCTRSMSIHSALASARFGWRRALQTPIHAPATPTSDDRQHRQLFCWSAESGMTRNRFPTAVTISDRC